MEDAEIPNFPGVQVSRCPGVQMSSSLFAAILLLRLITVFVWSSFMTLDVGTARMCVVIDFGFVFLVILFSSICFVDPTLKH